MDCFRELSRETAESKRPTRHLIYMSTQVSQGRDAYRDTGAWAEVAVRADELEAARRAEIATVPSALRRLYERRQARRDAGMIGVVAAVAMFLVVLLPGWELPVLVLMGAWPTMAVAYVIGLVSARWHFRGALRRSVRRTDDLFADLHRLERDDLGPVARARELANQRAHSSYAWPLMAAALLGPLTLHLLLAILISGELPEAEFSKWIAYSALFTGPAHVYAAWAAWQFPRRRRLWELVSGAALWGLFPGAVAFCVPPLIVLATGAVVALLCFVPMGALIDREAAVATLPPGEGVSESPA